MPVSRVSRKGLVSIPSKVRKALKIEEGDLLVWEVNLDERSATIRVLKDPYKHLKGRYRDAELTYEKVEEKADKEIMGEAGADTGA